MSRERSGSIAQGYQEDDLGGHSHALPENDGNQYETCQLF